jgi:hypothetical protein
MQMASVCPFPLGVWQVHLTIEYSWWHLARTAVMSVGLGLFGMTLLVMRLCITLVAVISLAPRATGVVILSALGQWFLTDDT